MRLGTSRGSEGEDGDWKQRANGSRPTIVLVHGGFADATGFGAVIRALHERGFAAIGVPNPLRHLTDDAAYVADFLQTISGPIVLVGHS